MTRFALIFIVSLVLSYQLRAQSAFADACVGTWTGTMHIYSKGTLKDSVPVRLTVTVAEPRKAWAWKTEYLSSKMPVVKDYTLRLKDAAKHEYVTDEGDGVVLADYLFGNKLYSVFETQGIVLTSTYELLGDRLIFEVTSGKKQPEPSQGVTNYSVDNLQRVVFKKNS
ncbi:hypothetical protein [Spirosoma sp.]|uniref:hypothetical protein n=1 Tax=Spirosoma sp. TaxID=1899569 RepID=UPI002620EA9A|nr:hypothetical protein [Spirosoma sp.]MCX6218993.1 hypothetical protein [Spirosoma sp.]